jgi:hypothetical protein
MELSKISNPSSELNLEDPLLMKASKQFPENAEIAKIVFAPTAKAGNPVQTPLITPSRPSIRSFPWDMLG